MQLTHKMLYDVAYLSNQGKKLPRFNQGKDEKKADTAQKDLESGSIDTILADLLEPSRKIYKPIERFSTLTLSGTSEAAGASDIEGTQVPLSFIPSLLWPSRPRKTLTRAA